MAEHQPIVEIQTDKATVEVGSPVGGVVLRIIAAEGELAAVGATLALIGAPGEQLLHSVASPPIEAPPADEPIVAVVGSEPLDTLPLHRLARELSVDLSTSREPGPGGRLLEEDVRAAAAPPEGRLVPGAGHQAGDRRAGRANASGSPGSDIRRGVRLHGRRPRPARRRTLGVAASRCASFPSSTRASTAARSSCSTATTSGLPSTPKTGSSSRSYAGATGSPSSRSPRRSQGSPTALGPGRCSRTSCGTPRSLSRAPESSAGSS